MLNGGGEHTVSKQKCSSAAQAAAVTRGLEQRGGLHPPPPGLWLPGRALVSHRDSVFFNFFMIVFSLSAIS